MLKSLSNQELQFYSNSIFAVRGIGPFKWWVLTKYPKQDIRKGKFAGFAHVKKAKVVKIHVPVDHTGAYMLSPSIVFSQLRRSDFIYIDGYSVRVFLPNKNVETKHREYEAKVTLYTTKRKPAKLLLGPPKFNNKIEKYCEEGRQCERSYKEIVDRCHTL